MRQSSPLLVVAVLLAACGAFPAGEPTTTLPEAATDLIETAIADLAARLDVDPGGIRLIESSAVTWPDASLGCPRADKVYAQVETDGFRLALGYEDRAYDYHAGEDADPFLCASEERDGGREFIPPPGFDS